VEESISISCLLIAEYFLDTFDMASFEVIIDLTDDTVDEQHVNKKQKVESTSLEYVWIAYHQLEADYDCVGDFENDRCCYSHFPTTFDKTILGIFRSQNAAKHCAHEYCIESGLIDDCGRENRELDEDDPNAGFDFEDEGVLLEGRESGNTLTLSQRVHIKRERFQNI
jgi:hypothetical protein